MQDLVGNELADAVLGDVRLTNRAVMIANRWSEAPSLSFPRMIESSAELQGFYGFVENESVEYGPLLESHTQQTLRRVDAEAGRVVLFVHDTTSFAFGGDVPRDGMGWLGHDQQGFFGHFALAVSADRARRPLGVVGLHVIHRPRPPRRSSAKEGDARRKYEAKKERSMAPDRESLRWVDLIEETGTRARGRAVPIHIADREADSYAFLVAMRAGNHRFVARVRVADRPVASMTDEPQKREKLSAVVERCEPLTERRVAIARRKASPLPANKKTHPPRDARSARLEFAATRVRLPRPKYLGADLPATIDVNLVHVRELDTPAGCEPVEWLLFTSEPISSVDEVLRVVDFYRARWTIEEFFKAIKTGCAYETRQLETARGLLVALALCLPVAWQMLALRAQSRTAPDADALTVISAERLDVLQTIARKPLPEHPTANDVYYAIAALGGHLKQNGPPGWQTLRAGLDHLLLIEAAFAARDVRFGWQKGCDE